MSVFLDTNVLIYALLEPGKGESRKQSVARELVFRDDCVLSVQVFNEFIAQATRATRLNRVTFDYAMAHVESLYRFPVQELTVALLGESAQIMRSGRFSWWDAMIIAAARAQGCEVLYSEDLQHGRIIDGMRIVNPFR